MKVLLACPTIEVDRAQKDQRTTPLFMAALHGHAVAANLLLASGADKCIKAMTGETPLMIASRAGHSAIMQLLQSPSRFPTGTRVELRGLQAKPELNGQQGAVIKFVASSGRYAVRVDGGVGDFQLRPENIV